MASPHSLRSLPSSSEQPILIAISVLFIFSHLHLTLSCGYSYSRPHIFSILLLVLYRDTFFSLFILPSLLRGFINRLYPNSGACARCCNNVQGMARLCGVRGVVLYILYRCRNLHRSIEEECQRCQEMRHRTQSIFVLLHNEIQFSRLFCEL